ncbi:uncharacterized protein LACBIDRAFT_332668 [Laccaria bicolor S238N-H82]|uniref:Predicted protein n=1 Tax=Laccaria bicolor (strain S238N-H82 / ATCC MYA-4686) TaxID=486041 RepID=B0DTH5_LACBS|nr:uncharacterized protein LACBIDRAFT_332668 [Laccaria bicolor S238N-H82]EDR02065.1 predicted protein [Laccaria bicolor S238N-H82]|eukprot:XP_001887222.1 predicted protein [Laccaria bicolor S238N-H82]
MNFLPNAMYGMAMTPGHSGIASAQSNGQVSPLQFNFPPQTPSSDVAMANVNAYENLSIGQKRPHVDVDPGPQEMWQPCCVPLVSVDGSGVTDLSDLLAVVFRRMKKAEAELADQSGVYQQVLAQIDVLEKQIGELEASKDSEPSGEPTKKQKEPQDRGIRNRVISHALVQMETVCSTQIVVANELDYMSSEDENSGKIEPSIWQEKADRYVRPGQTAVEVRRVNQIYYALDKISYENKAKSVHTCFHGFKENANNDKPKKSVPSVMIDVDWKRRTGNKKMVTQNMQLHFDLDTLVIQDTLEEWEADDEAADNQAEEAETGA